MAGRLQDKIAIITGAGCAGPGWGNGRAAAVIFAQQGAKVFAVDLKAEAMEETVASAGLLVTLASVSIHNGAPGMGANAP